MISTDSIQCKGQLEPEFNRSEQTESFIEPKPNITSPPWARSDFRIDENGQLVNLDEAMYQICPQKVIWLQLMLSSPLQLLLA